MDRKYTANTDPLLKERNWWIVLLLLWLVCAMFTQVKYANASTEVSLPSGFDLQAHRGGRDARPENTLPAFAYALALGVTTLELDVQITGDGVMVVWHNKSIPWYMARNAYCALYRQ